MRDRGVRPRCGAPCASPAWRFRRAICFRLCHSQNQDSDLGSLGRGALTACFHRGVPERRPNCAHVQPVPANSRTAVGRQETSAASGASYISGDARASGAGRSGVLGREGHQGGGDVVDLKLAGHRVVHELLSRVLVQRPGQRVAAEPEEQPGGGPGEPLVAVDQGMIAAQGCGRAVNRVAPSGARRRGPGGAGGAAGRTGRPRPNATGTGGTSSSPGRDSRTATRAAISSGVASPRTTRRAGSRAGVSVHGRVTTARSG